jgi:hypothetical protein
MALCVPISHRSSPLQRNRVIDPPFLSARYEFTSIIGQRRHEPPMMHDSVAGVAPGQESRLLRLRCAPP